MIGGWGDEGLVMGVGGISHTVISDYKPPPPQK